MSNQDDVTKNAESLTDDEHASGQLPDDQLGAKGSEAPGENPVDPAKVADDEDTIEKAGAGH